MSQRSCSRAPGGPGRRPVAALAAAVTVLAALAAVAPGQASAALPADGVGAVDPGSHFPSYYQDANGLALGLCQDGLPHCLAGPDPIQDVHAAGGDAEAFYFHASATLGDFTLEAALEAAYAGAGAGQEVTFMRRQAIATGVRAGGTYRFTDPYGSYTCTADAAGRVQPAKGCRLETTPVPGDFTAALNGPIGPFLTWDTFGSPAGAPPAGFIGDNTTPHTVVGSPNDFNKMRVEGPGIVGTCTNVDGSTVPTCRETDRLILQGKTFDTGQPTAAVSAGALNFGDVPGSPAVTRTLTYANTGRFPVQISAITVAGANAEAFSRTTTCPVAAPLDAGARCTIDVTFTPQAGRSSAATLTITDDTPVATRTVALQGSNLPVMVVADPAPPTALAFGSQSTATPSAESNVVLHNTGNGPLTVASVALTGPSAGSYRLGPNNTCTTPVLPDGGCELGVVFAPSTTGGKTANLRVTDSNGKVVNVPLTGTGIVPPADTTAPSAPTLSGSLAGSTANLTWTAARDDVGVTGYQVFRGGTQVGVLAGTVTSFSQSGLAAGTHSFTVRALDAAGNTSAASNAVALTVPAPNAAPTVTARTPAVNATSVGVAANLTATFSEAVDGVGTGTFQVKDPAGTVVAGSVTKSATSNRWTLNPTASLSPDTRYTVTLTGGTTAIRDLAGAPLATTTWSFTTGPAPTVTARTPATGALGVRRNANVTATFSEPVSGVAGATVTLRNASTGAQVPAVVSYNATTRVATVNPNAALAASTRYQVNLIGGATSIRDLAGNPLASVTWTFTTGTAF